jgi:hypothetical protein
MPEFDAIFRIQKIADKKRFNICKRSFLFLGKPTTGNSTALSTFLPDSPGVRRKRVKAIKKSIVHVMQRRLAPADNSADSPTAKDLRRNRRLP